MSTIKGIQTSEEVKLDFLWLTKVVKEELRKHGQGNYSPGERERTETLSLKNEQQAKKVVGWLYHLYKGLINGSGMKIYRDKNIISLVSKNPENDVYQKNFQILKELFPDTPSGISQKRGYSVKVFSINHRSDAVSVTISGSRQKAPEFYPDAKRRIEEKGFLCGDISRRTFIVFFSEDAFRSYQSKKILQQNDSVEVGNPNILHGFLVNFFAERTFEVTSITIPTETGMEAEQTIFQVEFPHERNMERAVSLLATNHVGVFSKNVSSKSILLANDEVLKLFHFCNPGESAGEPESNPEVDSVESVDADDELSSFIISYLGERKIKVKGVNHYLGDAPFYSISFSQERVCKTARALLENIEKVEVLPSDSQSRVLDITEAELQRMFNFWNSGLLESQQVNVQSKPKEDSASLVQVPLKALKALLSSLSEEDIRSLLPNLQPKTKEYRDVIIAFNRFLKRDGNVIHVDGDDPVTIKMGKAEAKSVGKKVMDDFLDKFLEDYEQ